MAASTQHNLANIIKTIHKKLREDSKSMGAEQAWDRHLKDQETLDEYSATMQELALSHWDKNSLSDQKVVSRIVWTFTACQDYFENIDKFRRKELDIAKNNCQDKEAIPTTSSGAEKAPKYRLLDVGSCYNPFKIFEIFEVVPLDIAPASSEVLHCDFTNVEVGDNSVITGNRVKQLEKEWFDIVVFSLLLEYLPSPEQRLKCCIKAYNLLKREGVLVIVTPDSNHVGSNAKIFKSWQYVLARQGFVRVKYEKLPYLHCMLFRKAQLKVVAERWATVHESKNFYKQIFIPQDFTEAKTVKSTNHYESLGLGKTATQADVKSAYYELSKIYHPDRNQGTTADQRDNHSQKFRDITEAYEVLGNVKTRRMYDKGYLSQRPKESTAQRTPDDPLHNFYKSRESRKRTPNVDGRQPIYNFDEWSRNHYGDSMRKAQEMKQRKAFYDKRADDESSAREFEVRFYGFLLCVFVCMLLREFYQAVMSLKPKKTYAPSDN
ncbi:hypothetical protein YQE_11886, partial [Dendroctonus ponderosae]